MTTEKPAQGGVSQAYFRADAASRQVVLHVGLGVVSFVVGSILSVGASARIGERIGFIESDWVALVLRLLFERLWLFTVLPAFGYAIGRFTETSPTRFALVSGLSGETFSVLLVSAINGFDFLMEDVTGLIARVVTLFLGLSVTAWAVKAGRDVSAEAQIEADAIAEKKKAEYAAFLAAAEKGSSGMVNPHPDPLPKGEGDTSPKADGDGSAPLPDPLPAAQGEGDKSGPGSD